MKLPLRLLTYWLPDTPRVLVYMLQQVAYEPGHFARWLLRVPAMNQVMRRQELVKTKKAMGLLLVAYGSWAISFAVGLVLVVGNLYVAGAIALLSAPLVSVLSLGLVTLVAQKIIVDPRQAREIGRAKSKLAGMKTVKIAVLGSYGKTTMKELLDTVLSEAKKVAATPGNKNVLISHARWVNGHLDGNEEVLIFEYGEARPGDIAMLSDFSRPDIAVITGLAPAHLENYGSLDSIGSDFSDIGRHVSPDFIYLNGESVELAVRINSGHKYDMDGVDGWKLGGITADMTGTVFTISKGPRKLTVKTGLIGLHQLGPLSAVVDIAAKLGLSDSQIEYGLSKTRPFKHRMSPYKLAGSWVIDDTYNGNLEGAKAGLKFLSEIESSGNKIYVTPGFVEQGELKEEVHLELGRAIAEAGPDRVVLMRNSTTEFIQAGLDANDFSGELVIEGDPLAFYTNLEHFVAGGDVVLLQNDWTDNYQ